VNENTPPVLYSNTGKSFTNIIKVRDIFHSDKFNVSLVIIIET